MRGAWRTGRKVGNTVYTRHGFAGSCVTPGVAAALVADAVAGHIAREHAPADIAELISESGVDLVEVTAVLRALVAVADTYRQADQQ